MGFLQDGAIASQTPFNLSTQSTEDKYIIHINSPRTDKLEQFSIQWPQSTSCGTMSSESCPTCKAVAKPSFQTTKYVLCCVIWYILIYIISPGTGLLDRNFTNVTFGALYTLFRKRATLSCKTKFGLDFRPPKCLSISVVLVVAVWLLLLQLPSLARDEQLSWHVL